MNTQSFEGSYSVGRFPTELWCDFFTTTSYITFPLHEMHITHTIFHVMVRTLPRYDSYHFLCLPFPCSININYAWTACFDPYHLQYTSFTFLHFVYCHIWNVEFECIYILSILYWVLSATLSNSRNNFRIKFDYMEIEILNDVL